MIVRCEAWGTGGGTGFSGAASLVQNALLFVLFRALWCYFVDRALRYPAKRSTKPHEGTTKSTNDVTNYDNEICRFSGKFAQGFLQFIAVVSRQG